MSDNFTAYEKGLDEKNNLVQAKVAATTKAQAIPLQPRTSPTASQGKQTTYPLIPDEPQKAQILAAYNKRAFASTRSKWLSIRDRIVKDTLTQQYMGFSLEKDVLTDFNQQTDVVNDVLFVAMRFNWNPDEVLALWQMEGLPVWIQNRDHLIDIGEYYEQVPRNRAEARAFARSITLFEWWGLDALVPVESSKEGDNQIALATIDEHDRAFKNGFTREISSIFQQAKLLDSPVESLKQAFDFPGDQFTSFRFKREYQATLLALQFARFKYKEGQIPGSLANDRGKTVSLKPPFPALVYLYFNSKFPEASVRKMMQGFAAKKRLYTSQELCRAFLTTPLPREVSNWIDKHCPGKKNCHGYMNALRFEFLRQVYEIYFQPTNIGTRRGC